MASMRQNFTKTQANFGSSSLNPVSMSMKMEQSNGIS